jgi:hypothetical protein
VIADLLEELLLAAKVADMIVERLRDAGFVIRPADEPGLKREIERLKEAKRRALMIADERAKEAVELRLENERLNAQLAECDRP